MSFTEQKRLEIKKYILRKIATDDPDMVEKTKDSFGISITSVKRYLKEFLMMKYIEGSGEADCGFRLVSEECEVRLPMADYVYEEDILCREHIIPNLTNCNKKAKEIWQYVAMEILNNALEHSEGGELVIWIRTNCLYTTLVIADDGKGAFKTLLTTLAEKGWKVPKIEDAIVELLKGKMTSAPQAHSGEGIFFCSKMVDRFALWSDNHIACWKAAHELSIMQSHLLAYAERIGKVGTCVTMSLENETNRDMRQVFDKYADIEQGVFKTEIPVYCACLYSQPVARSQARRICKRLDEFKEVNLDFTDVEFMGQGFADEIFRVYALAHPKLKIRIINASAEVLRMVHHVARGNMSENIAFAPDTL